MGVPFFLSGVRVKGADACALTPGVVGRRAAAAAGRDGCRRRRLLLYARQNDSQHGARRGRRRGGGGEEDPRIAELREINARLKVVLRYLKAKHTPRSIESSIAAAEGGLNDHTPAFITVESTMIEGTRHLGSLLRLCDALDIKAEMGGAGAGALDECTALLERKLRLLREVYGV